MSCSARKMGCVTTDDPEYPLAARTAPSLAALDDHLIQCRACPRLVAWREHVAEVKRASFRDDDYWARPVPGFGDERAGILVVGLAPAAHGANRTGRMFTGDRSGDFLFASMHRTGLANQATSVSADDGLRLTGIRVTAPVRCAPPDNKPTPEERRRCGPYLAREVELLGETVRVAVVLGGFGWQALLSTLAEQGWDVPRPRPRFTHGAEVTLRRRTPAPGTDTAGAHHDGEVPDGGQPPPAQTLTLLGCFHVSQQNTFTGRLTPQMLDDVLLRARDLAGLSALD
ncbi:uracil-DNA glycosylase [Cellulosimicrobium cellulans]|uniref:Type-5 uracil-DNA glycosylase n=2 Tax=Cellulosimicrobium TaxID=157920 RepID=A0A0H2KTZ1_9MICO|nr:uracil-DNA glycosylase [Cellulosimicrobium funkei]